jgi:hypothetical protein
MSDQGQVYLAFIEGELRAERERRSTYDSRGQALVATSGVLVALLSGIAAAAEAGLKVKPPAVAIGVALVALVLFVVSAALGIVAGWNKLYTVAAYTALDEMLSDHYRDLEAIARNNVGTVHAKTIRSLRATNQFKAACISYGLVFQLLALITFAITIIIILGQAN